MATIEYRNATYRDCAEARHHMRTLDWCNKWMAESADALPGNLTHAAVARESTKSECALLDYRVYRA